MTCPNCRHDLASDARFCAQCGAPLTPPMSGTPPAQAPTAGAAQPVRRRNTGVILLALLVLILAVGGGAYAVRRAAATTPATTTREAAQNGARPERSAANTGVRQQAAQAAVPSVPDTAPRAGGNGGPDPGKALDGPPQTARPVDPHDPPIGARGTDPAGAGQGTGAMAGLLGALSSAVGGAHPHDPVDFHTLEALLPSSLPGMQDATPGGSADDTMSIKTTSAHVDFTGPSGARVHLSIRDATAISGLAGLADMANADSAEQGDSYEKTETIAGRSVHETWDATTRHGELSLSVGERFAVDVAGDNVGMDALKNALARIDLATLESMKDANPKAK